MLLKSSLGVLILGESLSSYLKSLAKSGVYDQDNIVFNYERWVSEDRYMVLAHQREEWVSDGGSFEYVAVKCSKRGNDVYQARVAGRLDGLGSRVLNVSYDYRKVPLANVLFATLTYDTKLCSFAEAWQNIGAELNRFKANIQSKYGRVSAFRTWESYGNGYPHVHVILIFQDYEFPVFLSYSENKRGQLVPVWRVKEKLDLERYWHSHIDVRAVDSVKGGIGYVKKYASKCAHYSSVDRKSVKTLAMCWVFRKKAYYVSGEFRKALGDLIRQICISKSRYSQVDLAGAELKANSWKVLGFVGVDILGIDAVKWFLTLEKAQVDACFSEWDKNRDFD